MDNPIYLGDSVYIAHQDDQLIIYLDNGYGPENGIVLEDEVALSLLEYLEKLIRNKEIVE